MEGKYRAVLERRVLPDYMQAQRWFGAKSRTLETLSIRDWEPLITDPAPAYLVSVRAYYNDGQYDIYLIPLAVATGPDADAVAQQPPQGRHRPASKGRAAKGMLYDSTVNDAFCARLLDMISGGLELKTQNGRLRGIATSALLRIARGRAPSARSAAAPSSRATPRSSSATGCC